MTNIKEVHISEIKSGDTIFHDGKVRTVCNSNIKNCSFMGKSLFGDSYSSGHKLVSKVQFAVPTSKGIVLR